MSNPWLEPTGGDGGGSLVYDEDGNSRYDIDAGNPEVAVVDGPGPREGGAPVPGLPDPPAPETATPDREYTFDVKICSEPYYVVRPILSWDRAGADSIERLVADGDFVCFVPASTIGVVVGMDIREPSDYSELKWGMIASQNGVVIIESGNQIPNVGAFLNGSGNTELRITRRSGVTEYFVDGNSIYTSTEVADVPSRAYAFLYSDSDYIDDAAFENIDNTVRTGSGSSTGDLDTTAPGPGFAVIADQDLTNIGIMAAQAPAPGRATLAGYEPFLSIQALLADAPAAGVSTIVMTIDERGFIDNDAPAAGPAFMTDAQDVMLANLIGPGAGRSFIWSYEPIENQTNLFWPEWQIDAIVQTNLGDPRFKPTELVWPEWQLDAYIVSEPTALTWPEWKLDATIVQNRVIRAELIWPEWQLKASVDQPSNIDVDLIWPAWQLDADMRQSTTVLTWPAWQLDAVLQKASSIRATLVWPELQLDAQLAFNDTISAALTWPDWRLDAQIVVTVIDIPTATPTAPVAVAVGHAYVVNAANGAVSRYAPYSADRIIYFDGETYVLRDGVLYEVSGDTDELDAPIAAEVRTFPLAAAGNRQTRPLDLYVSARSPQPVQASIIVDEDREQRYDARAQQPTPGQDLQRVHLAKGVKAQHIALAVRNREGADLLLNNVELRVAVLARRYGR